MKTVNPSKSTKSSVQQHPMNSASDIKKSDWKKFMSTVSSDSVDLILTNPPYAISRETGFSKVKNGVDRFAVSMDFGEWDHQEIDLKAFCDESYRVMRRGGTIIVGTISGR